MRKPNPRDFLEDILENIQDIEEFIAGLSFEQFAADKKTVKATVRSLEVIGEAVKNVPQDLLDAHAQIPWCSIARMRDKLIHHYLGGRPRRCLGERNKWDRTTQKRRCRYSVGINRVT